LGAETSAQGGDAPKIGDSFFYNVVIVRVIALQTCGRFRDADLKPESLAEL